MKLGRPPSKDFSVICEAIDCDRNVKYVNYCGKHYARWYRGQDVNAKSRLDRTIEERLWHKVDKSGDCWEWYGSHDEHGYGHINIGKNKKEKTHRLSWEFANGPIPDGLCVLHHCDNPKCVRPDHLFIGTTKDNIQDCIAKGRFVFLKSRPGELNNHAKFTDGDIRVIRNLYEDGMKPKDIQEFMGVNRSCFHKIVTRKAWAHVE